MGQSQKKFFFAICYIAGGLCPNFSLLASKLWKKIGEKGIKWPLLYIYTSSSCPGFPGGFLSRGMPCTGGFLVPGDFLSRGISCPRGFLVPGDFLSRDFLSRGIPCPGGFLVPGISCPGGFLIPGDFLSRGISCPEGLLIPRDYLSLGFLVPGDFLSQGISCPGFLPPTQKGSCVGAKGFCTNATFPLRGAITCIALAL